MIFRKLNLPNAYVIEPEPFKDERGLFRRHFCQKEFAKYPIMTNIAQCNVSENKYQQTLRGFHYQCLPNREGKILSCFKGSIYDVIVDIRPESPTYLRWITVELNEDNRSSLYVPPGCANAFLTLKDDSLIFYYCSEFYSPGAERGIRYNDPLFQFQWPAEPSVISEKDKHHPNFVNQKKSD